MRCRGPGQSRRGVTRMLRVACIGAGYFSQFHIGSWHRMKNAKLVGVADLNPAVQDRDDIRGYTDAAAMLSETRPDILDIITPPVVQAEMIRIGIASGVPTIVCQKPFCQSLAEAEAVTAEAEAAQVHLIVHENFRFMPWYRLLKQEIDAETIGAFHQATFRLRPGDGQGARAYLDRQPYFQNMPRFLIEETAVHWIDTFRFLLGNPVSVYADLRQLNPVIAGEDAGFVILDFGGGRRALFDGNRHLDHASDNLRRTMGEGLFEGSAGTLSLFGDGRVERRSFGKQSAEVILEADAWEGFGGDCVHALQSHVVAGVLQDRATENNARSYLEVLRIRDAIYLSDTTGEKVAL